MAEAESEGGGGSGIDGMLIIFVLIVFIVLWLRQGGWEKLQTAHFNFGWQPASTTTAFPFAPSFNNLAPHVNIPTGPSGPDGPQSPNPYK